MRLSDEDKRYLIRLNMETGMGFDEACAASFVDLAEGAVLFPDRSGLPVEPSLSDLMERVLRCVSEGADIDVALVLEGASDAQAEFLRANPGFLARVRRLEAILLMQDRRRLSDLVEANMERGISTELRWRMGAVDPRFRSKGVMIQQSVDIPLPEIV